MDQASPGEKIQLRAAATSQVTKNSLQLRLRARKGCWSSSFRRCRGVQVQSAQQRAAARRGEAESTCLSLKRLRILALLGYRERWLDAEGEAKPRRTKAARRALLREAERQSMAELQVREDSTQKELSPEQRSPSRDPSKRSPLTATAATATGGQSGYRSPGPEVCCTLASSRLGRIQRP